MGGRPRTETKPVKLETPTGTQQTSTTVTPSGTPSVSVPTVTTPGSTEDAKKKQSTAMNVQTLFSHPGMTAIELGQTGIGSRYLIRGVVKNGQR